MTVEVVEIGPPVGAVTVSIGGAGTAGVAVGTPVGANRLDDLTDVDATTAGLTGHTLVKAADGQWRPAAPPAAAVYTHTQTTPAASWSGTHGLGRYPQAILLDAAGKRFLADLEFPTVNTYSVTHAEPLAGALHLQ